MISVGVETSDNNKSIANNSLLPYALYDGGIVICKSYYKYNIKGTVSTGITTKKYDE